MFLTIIEEGRRSEALSKRIHRPDDHFVGLTRSTAILSGVMALIVT